MMATETTKRRGAARARRPEFPDRSAHPDAGIDKHGAYHRGRIAFPDEATRKFNPRREDSLGSQCIPLHLVRRKSPFSDDGESQLRTKGSEMIKRLAPRPNQKTAWEEGGWRGVGGERVRTEMKEHAVARAKSLTAVGYGSD